MSKELASAMWRSQDLNESRSDLRQIIKDAEREDAEAAERDSN